MPSWPFELRSWGLPPNFSLPNRSDLPGSWSIFGISQGPAMYVHTSLSQDGFYQQGVWVGHPLALLPFALQGAFSAPMCGQAGLLT